MARELAAYKGAWYGVPNEARFGRTFQVQVKPGLGPWLSNKPAVSYWGKLSVRVVPDWTFRER